MGAKLDCHQKTESRSCCDKLPVEKFLVLDDLQRGVHDGDQKVHHDDRRDDLVTCHQHKREGSLGIFDKGKLYQNR